MATTSYQVPLLATDAAQDRILEEFLDKNKTKAALEHLDKRLKKARKEQVPRLQLMRVLLLIQKDRLLHLHEDPSSYMPAHVAALAEIAPQFAVDYACLEAVDDAGKGTWSSQFWAKACDIHAEDEQVPDAWFEIAFRREQYDDAAKACFMWRKNFPQRYQELTWRMILSHHLASKGSEVKEKQQKMSRQMCSRLIDQAITNTPPKDAKAPTIRSQLDLELVCEVKMAHGEYEALLTTLDSQIVGLRSPMGNYNLALTKAEVLDKLAKKDELRQFSKEILQDVLTSHSTSGTQYWGFGASGDDRLFVRYLVRLTTPESYEDTKFLLDSLAEIGSTNADWGLPSLHFTHGSQKVALGAAKTVWRKYAPRSKGLDSGVADAIPEDLKKDLALFAQAFAEEKLSQLENQTDQSSSRAAGQAVASIIQSYELQGKLLASMKKADEIENLVTNCLLLWQLSFIIEPKKPAADNGIGDEAIILAARLCLLLYHLNGTRYQSSISHARLLLETLVLHSKHNFRALIFLIRICLFQGAASQAMFYYYRLDIKNLQYITESPMMFADISYVVSAGGQHHAKLLSTLGRMHHWVRGRSESYDTYVVEALNQGNWAGVLDQIELKRTAFSSRPAALLAVEICRLGHLSKIPLDVDLVASAQEFLEQLAKRADIDPSAKGDAIKDSVSKQFPFEQKLLDLTGFTIAGSATAGFWTSLMMNDTRNILRGGPPSGVVPPKDATCSEVVLRASHIVRALLDNQKSTGVVDNHLSVLTTWVEQRGHEIDNCPRTDLYTTNTVGSTIVRAHSTLEALQFLAEVSSWIMANGSKHKTQATTLASKIRETHVKLLGWAQIQRTPDEDAISASVKFVSLGKVGEKVAALVGPERLNELVRQHLDSVQIGLAGLKVLG